MDYGLCKNTKIVYHKGSFLIRAVLTIILIFYCFRRPTGPMEGSPTASPTACARHRRSSWTTPGSIPQTYSSGENNNLKRGGGEVSRVVNIMKRLCKMCFSCSTIRYRVKKKSIKCVLKRIYLRAD